MNILNTLKKSLAISLCLGLCFTPAQNIQAGTTGYKIQTVLCEVAKVSIKQGIASFGMSRLEKIPFFKKPLVNFASTVAMHLTVGKVLNLTLNKYFARLERDQKARNSALQLNAIHQYAEHVNNIITIGSALNAYHIPFLKWSPFGKIDSYVAALTVYGVYLGLKKTKPGKWCANKINSLPFVTQMREVSEGLNEQIALIEGKLG
ncbi:MAG: hypothetical protein UU47_C0012G0016 [candidate division TM6 bacterium GW2011_GWE2_41_16]|nr:MAG: hypothetical protein UU47_C0012G0016 [candidate division TM6 bacterium GW2011_GWE2_41_16]